jgi:hypothetical protein
MNLPTELYVRIFDQSKLNDRIQMSNVSKLFNRLHEQVEYSGQIKLIEVINLPKNITNVKFLLESNIENLNSLTHIKHLDLKEVDHYNDFTQLKLTRLKSLSLDMLMTKDTYISNVQQIKSFTELERLSVTFIFNSNYHLEFFQELSHLDSIEANFVCCANDQDLEKLSRLQNIKRLGLLECSVTQQGLLHLRNFEKLERLNLNDIYPEDFKNLGELKIKRLEFKNKRKYTIDLNQFKGLKKLERLSLRFNQNYDHKQLNKLNNLDSLIKLELFVDRVTVDLAHALNQLTNIKYLSLNSLNEISYEDFENLKYISKLKSIELDFDNVEQKIFLRLKL